MGGKWAFNATLRDGKCDQGALFDRKLEQRHTQNAVTIAARSG
jgi:hypothetical protein